MATNEKFSSGDKLYLAVASGVVSGDPAAFGKMVGVAQTDRDADGKATLDFEGVYNLSVKGVDASGNLAIAAGDKLYFTVGDTPKINVKATGIPMGYALEAVNSGATATIQVRLASL
jgi:predicted RecA/RadA family phage recombinase